MDLYILYSICSASVFSVQAADQSDSRSQQHRGLKRNKHEPKQVVLILTVNVGAVSSVLFLKDHINTSTAGIFKTYQVSQQQDIKNFPVFPSGFKTYHYQLRKTH